MRNTKMVPSVIGLLLLATAHHSSGFSLKHYLNFLQNYNRFDPSPESWKGRWFPDKPPASSDEPPYVISENNMTPGREHSDDDSWKGRWFPDKPVILAHPAPSSSYSREDMDGQSWNGRSFPESQSSQKLTLEDASSTGSSQDYLVDDSKNVLSSGGPSPFNQLTDHLREMIKLDNSQCDDAKQNLTLDFPPDESHFVCHSGDRYIQPQFELPSILTKYPIPPAFYPSHRCMNVSIEYPYSPPTFGNHRPNWARWGEYEYLPPQRWVHNLEHGGIVMLYNPCAHHFLINGLREIVRKCLYKHIITPYRLPSERPVALIAWGWSLTMSNMDEEVAKKFIEDRANRGPEMIDTDGKYDLYLRSSFQLMLFHIPSIRQTVFGGYSIDNKEPIPYPFKVDSEPTIASAMAFLDKELVSLLVPFALQK